ncbi:hypothetical protein O0L34_g14169 [Tuta absoluta]|nr:hypothetical protein O0L34_g14169 [Tuta absoluta]
MAIIPITLDGDNLGKRHEQLNNLVNEAFLNNVAFETICDVPEESAIDRLFKIDLASKYKKVDYILKTLKENDMFYVSRAMKCNWLITDDKYMEIINPTNLEQNLYPDMRTNATNKMKHWIQLNLKEENRCKDFYEYYKREDINYAMKFLPECPVDFYIKEMDSIPRDNIKPQFLKLLCERSATPAETYFKTMEHCNFNEEFMTKIKCLLKSDPGIYFYVIENFFFYHCKRLNQKASRYILTRHREKFDAKPELYTLRILNLSSIASALNSEEIQELIIKMARAEYLYNKSESKFNYEFAKPLIKAIDPKERSSFCTRIFTEKNFGELIKEPPYFIPMIENKKPKKTSLDNENEDYDKALEEPKYPRTMKCCGRFQSGKYRSELDNLYDQYRFTSFEKTFAELRQRIKRESNMNMRQNMMLVLVSKTGGRAESVEALLNFMVENHINEPINLRATIVRSFVKRAFAWRWPDSSWEKLLNYGHDLGLDGGTTSEVECHEGLHAVVLRHIISNNVCPTAVWNIFLDDILSLNEYKLNSFERRLLHERLPALVMSSASTESNPETIIKRLTDVCGALESYKVKIDNYPGYMDAVTEFAQKHMILAKPLLLRIFKAGIGRKQMFRENFEIIQTDASYTNALRHDSTLLSEKRFEELLSNISNLHHDRFIRKIALYFGEKDGLATRFMQSLQNKASQQPHVKLARPMALLSRANAFTWPLLDMPEDKAEQQKFKKMMESLHNNSFLTWQKLPQQLDSKDVGLAAVATWIQTSSPNQLERRMDALLTEPKHALLVLALRATKIPGAIVKSLEHAKINRPTRVLCVAIRILRRNSQAFSAQDFEAILYLVSSLNLRGKRFERYCDLARLNQIPKPFRATYALALYQNMSRLGFGPEKNSKSRPYYRIGVPLVYCITNHLDEMNPDHIQIILKEFLDNMFTSEVIEQFKDVEQVYKKRDARFDFRKYMEACMVLIARYLITGKSDDDVNKRIVEVYEPFEQKLKELWHINDVNYFSSFYHTGYFDHFLSNVVFTRVFLKDTEFSLPVLDKLCCFGDEIAPLNENFALNYSIKFVRLLRQAVKLSVKERPDLYCKRGKVEGEDAVNFVKFCFGKIVAADVEDLVSRHFQSIRIFYTHSLQMFLQKRLFYGSIDIIRGLLSDDSKSNAVIIGLSLYNYYFDGRSSDDGQLGRIISNLLKNTKTDEIKFFKKFTDMNVLHLGCC